MTMNGDIVEAFGKYLGHTTNNVAEWTAVKLALEAVAKYQPKRIQAYMDSELVCRQLNGQYRVKNPDLIALYNRVKDLASGYSISYQHVYRADNKLADREVNKALDQALGLKE
jgi:ribonuclease HI